MANRDDFYKCTQEAQTKVGPTFCQSWGLYTVKQHKKKKMIILLSENWKIILDRDPHT